FEISWIDAVEEERWRLLTERHRLALERNHACLDASRHRCVECEANRLDARQCARPGFQLAIKFGGASFVVADLMRIHIEAEHLIGIECKVHGFMLPQAAVK